MRSGGSGSHNDSPAAIPDFARAWESAQQVAPPVRRPSTLPDPETYHALIEPEAIFELDEKQEDGSTKTILVVPLSCKQCRTLKQACSRARPACVRCRNAGRTCGGGQEGYQRLPGPKIVKPSYALRKQASDAPASATRDPARGSSLGGTRSRRKAPESSTARPSPPVSEPPISTPSKRPLSPSSAPAPRPRKKAQTKATPRAREAQTKIIPREQEARRPAVPSPTQEVNPHHGLEMLAGAASARAATSEPRVLKWTFVKNREDAVPPAQDRPVPSDSLRPRVWTASHGGLLTAFPELGKSKTNFSWFQSYTPVLLLDSHARGRWRNSTTLRIDLSWDFSCHESELEPVVESDTRNHAQFPSCRPRTRAPEDSLDHGTEMMDSQDSNLPPTIRAFLPRWTVSAPSPTFNAEAPPPCGTPQGERAPRQPGWSNPMHIATSNGSVSTAHSTQLHPQNLLPSLENPMPSHSPPAPNGSLAPRTTSQPSSKPRIPQIIPPEVETLLDSHSRFTPLLLWLSHDSGLVPCDLPNEYAYICMGFFFISDVSHVVVQHSVSSAPQLVKGRVQWTVTLEWAPGGEGALFDSDSAPSSDAASDSALADASENLLQPWWHDVKNASSSTDNVPYRPRDLRMQFFSFIPLDLLAEFHPSESFPRGWFCKLCGMINVQVYFRHQICQSAICRSIRGKCVPPGKIDPLSSLRDIYQSSDVIQPNHDIPPGVDSESVAWDDDMESWLYSVKEGVTLCHVFTGNQESLQQDSTALLERIQCEVLLRKEEPPSPYFTHSTKLSYSNDGSEVTVPGGTPNCIRTAYHMLCDFVHRYGEMDKPRFGEVQVLGWVNPGTRKGKVFHASKAPVVIHCLGVQVTLNLTPKGGYKDGTGSALLNGADGVAPGGDRAGSPSIAPCAGPSRRLEPDNDKQPPFIDIPGLDANGTPVVADSAVAAMDTVSHSHSHDGEIVIPNSNTADSGMDVAPPEVVERRGRKKNKVTKDKGKASVPEISMTLVHGDCLFLCGDDFECQIVRSGTSVLVIGFPEEA